jgi:hypothetical protein
MTHEMKNPRLCRQTRRIRPAEEKEVKEEKNNEKIIFEFSMKLRRRQGKRRRICKLRISCKTLGASTKISRKVIPDKGAT